MLLLSGVGFPTLGCVRILFGVTVSILGSGGIRVGMCRCTLDCMMGVETWVDGDVALSVFYIRIYLLADIDGVIIA